MNSLEYSSYTDEQEVLVDDGRPFIVKDVRRVAASGSSHQHTLITIEAVVVNEEKQPLRLNTPQIDKRGESTLTKYESNPDFYTTEQSSKDHTASHGMDTFYSATMLHHPRRTKTYLDYSHRTIDLDQLSYVLKAQQDLSADQVFFR